jgi:hypothetical protein
MTDAQRNAVERLVQISLRQRAAQSVEKSLADETLIREIAAQLQLPEDAELRHLIASIGVPVQLELQNAVRRQAVRNFWIANRDSKALILPLLAIMLAVGAAIRVDKIASQSQWLDEYWAVYLATGRGNLIFNLPYDQLLTTAPACGFSGAPSIWHIWTGITGVTHPPLYYLTLRAWIDLFGDGDFATRMLSTVFSLGTILLMFDVVRRSTRSTGAALAAATMMALAPAQIDFSQTTRPYTMVLFLALIAADLLFLIETKGFSPSRIVALTIAFIALAMTHYFTVGAFIAMAAYTLLQFRGKPRKAIILSFAIALVVVLGAWGPMFWKARGLVALDGYVHGKGIGIYRSFFNLPRRLLLDMSLETGFLTLWAFAAVVFYSPPMRWKRHPSLLLWWLWVICVPGFLLIWDSIRGTHFTTVTRYVLLASPAIYAIFATPFLTTLGKLVPLAFVIAVAISGLTRWQDGPQGVKDFRVAARWIQDDIPPGDPVILLGGPDHESAFNYFAIAHYAGDWHRPVALLEHPASPALLAQLASYPRVWILGPGPLDRAILPGRNMTPRRSADGFILTEARR